jgi:predicted nucleic acid-binding protein
MICRTANSRIFPRDERRVNVVLSFCKQFNFGKLAVYLLDKVCRGGLRDNITAYDAMYVALAEAIEAPIVTCDNPLAKSPGHRARIEVID